MPIDVTATFSQREFMPLCRAEPLLIITIKLSLISTLGLPPTLVHNHLYTYLPGDIEHYILSFNFSTPESMNSYAADVDLLVRKLEKGELTRQYSSHSSFLYFISLISGSTVFCFF